MADFDTIPLIGAFMPSAIYGKYWLSTRYDKELILRFYQVADIMLIQILFQGKIFSQSK